MNVKYKQLATVSLQHDYYADGNCTDFSIVPAPHTLEVLKHLGAIYKISGNKLMIFVRVDGNNKAFIAIPDNESLVFYMISENPLFTNITNSTQQPSAGLQYYFTNKANGQPAGATLYLHHNISAYTAARDYVVGDMVTYNGTVLEAIRSSYGSSPTSITDPEAWAHRANTDVSYVNSNDLVTFVSPVYNYKLDTPAKNIEISVFRYDAAGAQVNVSTISQEFTTAKTSGSVLLDKLPAGYYNIVVKDKDVANNTTARNVYLDAAALYGNVFGVISLQTIADGSRLALLNTDGTLKSPVFVIRFAARALIWKYIVPRQIGQVAFGAEYDFYHESDPANKLEYYISNIPIPVVQYTSGNAPETDGGLSLPLPAVDKLVRTTLHGGSDTYFCIEKYLP